MRKINKWIDVLILILFACAAVVVLRAENSERKISVMTYNMYLGTDLLDIFSSQTPDQLALEVGEAFSDAGASNPAERIDEIADQIARNSPDVVGLQEVALWRYGAPLDPASAEIVAYDYLQILLDRLASRGVHYEAVSIQTNLDAELTGVGANFALDIRLTDRVVIIARSDLPTSELKIESADAGTFQTLLPVSILGNRIEVARGWASVDIKHRGKTYRFVNAHLEAFNDLVQQAQAYELLLGPTNTDRPVVLAGDFNSDPVINPGSYSLLLAWGFSDMWANISQGGPGHTWPLSSESTSVILNPSQRVDYLMARGNVTLSSIDLVGEDPVMDLTPSLSRPSDHAGLVGSLVLQP